MLPLEHVVPEATACQTTLPLLQRPNWVEPLQTMAPFWLQVPEAPPVEGVEGVPEPSPVEGAVGAAGEPVPRGGVGLTGAVGVAVTVTSVVEVEGRAGTAVGPTGEPLEAPGAKTPPPLGGAGAAEGLPPTAEVEATGGVVPEGDAPPAGEEGAEDGEPPAGEDGSAGVDPEAQPTGGFKSLVFPFSTTLPGLGNSTAEPSTCLQDWSMLMTSMSGSASKPLLSSEPPETSMGAQFI